MQNVKTARPCSFFSLLLFLFASSCSTSFNTYYVRTDGNDANSGLRNSQGKAFKSISHGISKLTPGDRLLVEDGEYVGKTIRIENLQGTAGRPITIRSVNKWGAILSRPDDANPDSSVVVVSQSTYVIFEGFEIYDSPAGIESGVDVRSHSHHITIRDNYIHDCACGGISSRESDYLTFESNVVRDNAKRNEWNCSGISVWHPIEHDQEPGNHIIIRKNIAFENECDLPFRPLGHDTPTDGNGIIVDDYRATQKIANALGQAGGFRSGTLIENNLCFNNGGKGINVYKSDNVTIRNNTCYHNLRILSKYGDFSGDVTVGNSKGLRFYNNIIVKHPRYQTLAFRCYDNDSLNTKIYNNIIIGEKDFSGQSLYDQDNDYYPAGEQQVLRFISPGTDFQIKADFDFRHYFGPAGLSPAIDSGVKDIPVSEDLDGRKRPVGEGVDIGCYETDIG